MSDVIRGQVEAVRKDKGAIKVGETWYNLTNVEKQGGNEVKWKDKVAFKCVKGKNLKGQPGFNITSVIKIEEKAQAPQGKGNYNKGGFNKGGNYKADPEKQASIMRQSCLGYASTLVAATMTAKSDVRKAAELAVQIATEVLFPFAEKGPGGKPQDKPLVSEAEEVGGEMTENLEEAEFESVDLEEDFDDDIPF